MKKKDEQSRMIIKLFCLSKILRIMKLTSLLLIISVLQVFAEDTYSQATKLSLDLGDATVEQVLNEIENNSEYYFLFNQDLVDVSRKVQGSFEDQQIDVILASVFESTDVDFYVMDRQMNLSPSEYLAGVKKMQPRTITGTVTQENGDPIIGATIIVKGTTIGTITDVDGQFQLEIPDDAEVLQISFVGMKTQEIAVADRLVFDLVMEEDLVGIDEVVVVGYGTQKRSDITGAVASLTRERLDMTPNLNIAQAIQGSIPGVMVHNNSAGTNPDQTIMVRGRNSILAANDPLIVVDGIPYGGNLSDINPNDV